MRQRGEEGGEMEMLGRVDVTLKSCTNHNFCDVEATRSPPPPG